MTHRKTIPYTFARVSVMKSKLTKKEEYHKLLKMDLNTITRYLQDSAYKESITKLSTKYRGVELVDMSLRREQYRIFNKLREYSPKSVVKLIDIYLKRFDFQNLKVVLRGIYSKTERDEIFALLEPIGVYRKGYYMDLFDLGEIQKVLDSVKFVNKKKIYAAFASMKKDLNLIDLENIFDKIYFEESIEASKELNGYGIQFKNFLLQNIDIINIKNLLRFKREGFDSNKIMGYMIIEGLYLNRAKLKKISKLENIESIIKNLKKTKYHKHINFNEKDELFDIELKLQKYLMTSAAKRSYKNFMSIECVLSFIIAKIIEIKNLRSIIKAKHLGIDEAFIEKKLLIV